MLMLPIIWLGTSSAMFMMMTILSSEALPFIIMIIILKLIIRVGRN